MSKMCGGCKHSERVDFYNVYCYKENHFFNPHRDACKEWEVDSSD